MLIHLLLEYEPHIWNLELAHGKYKIIMDIENIQRVRQNVLPRYIAQTQIGNPS